MNAAIIEPHAFGDTHEVALRILDVPRGGKILDAAAGEGYLTDKLAGRGYVVTAADIHTGQYKLSSPRPDAVDLNDRLPYENGVFDGIVCMETLEHVWNVGQCLCEFFRVLKPGGSMIISVPNITSLFSRMIFLFSGQFANFYDTHDSCVDRNGIDRHIMPLPSWIVKRLLKKAGFTVEATAYSNGGIEIPTRQRPWKKYVFLPHTALCGNSLILKARKRHC